jgi:hypothetical protein
MQVDSRNEDGSQHDTATGVVNPCRPSGPVGPSDTYSRPTDPRFGGDQHDPLGRLVQATDAHLRIEHRALLGVAQRGSDLSIHTLTGLIPLLHAGTAG